MRLMVYSHDTFGLGNIRRMLAICSHLLANISDLSILIVSGSPMLHSFRVHPGIDYIKLPCLKRTEQGDLGVRFLDLELEQIVRLRRELILSTVVSFQPDVVLVDKKPDGLATELEPSLRYIKCNLPQTRLFLILRDILDAPEVTAAEWVKRGYQNTVQWYYDGVLVLGEQRVFDVCEEYQFSRLLCQRVRYCGYVGRGRPAKARAAVRAELVVSEEEKLVLVTAGGGEDGYQLMSTYLDSAGELSRKYRVRTLMVFGPELAPRRAKALRDAAQRHSGIQMLEFTDEMMSYMNAADVVVSMAGYNTICELLTLRKRAVVVPRVKPVQEQKIRAERMAELSAFAVIHPDQLNPRTLEGVIADQLRALRFSKHAPAVIDLDALPRITEILTDVGAPAGSGTFISELELAFAS
jgi:predicted glycosyltransferase